MDRKSYRRVDAAVVKRLWSGSIDPFNRAHCNGQQMSLQVVQSPHSVNATADRLLAALNEREITMFTRIDHAGEARAAGLELADEQLVIFGDPRAGTLLMQLDPEIGYELPLHVLIWDAGGSTLLGYRPPTELAERYAVGGQAELLRRMTELIEALVAESTAS